LTQWVLSEVFVASGQYNASCCCAGSDEHIKIIGTFQAAGEARTVVDSQKKQMAAYFLHDCDERGDDVECIDVFIGHTGGTRRSAGEGKEDIPPSPLSPKNFISTLLIPDKDIHENWHADGTGCVLFQVREYDAHADCGIDRASLRVQKVSNIPASKPMNLPKSRSKKRARRDCSEVDA
jgi:hypothetical protein